MDSQYFMRIIKNTVHNRYLIMLTLHIWNKKTLQYKWLFSSLYYKTQNKIKWRPLREKSILQSHCLATTLKRNVLSNIYLAYPNVDVTCKISSRYMKRRICNSLFPTCNFCVSKYKGIKDCIKENLTILFKMKIHCRISKIHSHFQKKKKSPWSYFDINQKNFSRLPGWI